MHRLIGANEPVALAGLAITEVLQGVWRDAAAVIGLLAGFPWLEDEGLATYSGAAALAREARRRWVTISTVDAVLATLCLAHDAVLFTLERDF